ncbi:MAG: hypothetical protein Q7U28_18160 [Aquabacterium sp.]|nr:hypothetical protein [Aquabacterium sp.]
MSVNKLRRLPLAAAAMLACMGAQAGYQSPDGHFSLSGFGTLGASKSTTDDAIYNYPGQGGGSTKHGTLDPDSKIAVQGTYKFTPTVSGTTQVMTKYDAEGQYVPQISWAFAKWQVIPSLTLRAGRMGVPAFMISDFRDVGYANTPVRPPLDVYGQVPVSQFDGADASYQWELGGTSLTASVWAGTAKADYRSSITSATAGFTIERAAGFNALADLGNGWSVRAGHMKGKLSVQSDAITQLGTNAAALKTAVTNYAGLAALAGDGANAAIAAAKAATYQDAIDLADPSAVDSTFSGIGLAYDQDEWVGSLEFTKRHSKGFISSTTGWYGMLGYRINAFTPFVGLSKLKSDRRASSTPADATVLFSPAVINVSTGQRAGISAAAAAGDPALNAGLLALAGVQKQDERTVTMGVRWDATSSTAVKFQFDRISKPADSNGMFLHYDPAQPAQVAFTAQKRSISVMTLSVDFVF